jgi:AAA domain/TrwC relaxase
MPLRSKPGQSYVSVVVEGDELEVAAGKAKSKRLSEYYVAAYYSAGAGEGGGGKWAVAVSTGMDTGLHPAARANLVARGCAPGQPWTREKLEALLRGEGRRLGTVVKQELISGRVRRVKVAKTDTWVYDVPKSVSLLACYGFDDDGWLTNVVEDAARSGMEYLAEQTAFVRRRGADGLIERQRGSAIHYSLVLERTARSAEGPEDLTGLPAPHYHAHILIHGAFDRDGRYGAYDAHDTLTSGERQVASAYADLVLRQRLADRGIKMRRVDAHVDEEDEGTSTAATHWEVASISDRAIAIASERRRAILAAMAEDPQPGLRGSTGDAAAERLTKASKKASAVTDWARLRELWRELIEEGGAQAPAANPTPPGVSHGSVEAGRGDGQVELPTAGMLAGAASRVLTRFVATRSHFKLSELRAEILQEIDGTWNRRVAPEVMSAFVARWAVDAELIPLQAQDGSRYAFSDVLRQEYRILRLWERLSADVRDDLSVLAPAAIEAHEANSGHRLDPGQRHLVEEALRRRATIGMGVAGVGKTAAGDALRRAAIAAGRQVHSVALACLRARETGLDIGASRDESVRALLAALEDPEGLERHYRRGDVLLIDELSQLSDRALEGLLTAAERMDLHLVMLGDLSQQGPIGRGTMAGELMHRRGDAVVEMRVAHRFRDPVQAAALAEMHDGNAAPWVRYAAQRGWLRPFAREEEAAREILKLWQEDRRRLVITMGDNLRRDDLNDLVVAHLIECGEVSAGRAVEVRPDARSQRHVSLHEGQLIRLNRQLRQRVATGGWERVAKNGEVARLEAVIPGDVPERARVRLRFDEGRPAERLVEVEAGRLVATGAYALHTYKAQGTTAERVVVDWADGRGHCSTYPTLSRQRDEVVVVATSRNEEDRARGVDALAERITDSVARDDVSSPGVSMPRPRDWPAAIEVDAGRSEVELTPASPRDVRLWPERAPTPDPREPETVPRDSERPVVARMLDRERIAAAMRGELDLDQLTLGELSEAFAHRACAAQPPRLDQVVRADVATGSDPDMTERPREAASPTLREGEREPDRAATAELYSGGIFAGAGVTAEPPLQRDEAAQLPRVDQVVRADVAPGCDADMTDRPREAASPTLREGEREPHRAATGQRDSGGIAPGAAPDPPLGRDGAPAMHTWQPSTAQLTRLAEAEASWSAVLERKAATLDAGVRLNPTADRGELLTAFARDLEETWGGHASEHRVSDAAMPALDRDVVGRHAAAAELLLGRTPQAAIPDPEPTIEPAGTASTREAPAHDMQALAGGEEAERTRRIQDQQGEARAPREADPDVHAARPQGDFPEGPHHEAARRAVEPTPNVLQDELDDAAVLTREPQATTSTGAEVATEGDAAGRESARAGELLVDLDDTAVHTWQPQVEASPGADREPEANTPRATSPEPEAAEPEGQRAADVLVDEIDDTALLTRDGAGTVAAPSPEPMGADDALQLVEASTGATMEGEQSGTSPEPDADEPEAERAADVVDVELDDTVVTREAAGEGAVPSEEAIAAQDALQVDASTGAAVEEERSSERGTSPEPHVEESEVERADDEFEEIDDAWTWRYELQELDDTVRSAELADEVAMPSEEAMATQDALQVDASAGAAVEEERSSERGTSREPHAEESEVERADDEPQEIDDTVLRPELADEVAVPSEEVMAAQDSLQGEASTGAEMAAEPAGMESSGRGMEPE